MNFGFVFFFILIMGSQNSYSQDSFEAILLKKNNERKTDLKEERKKKTEIKLAKNETTQNETKAIEEESEETKPKKFKKNILADTTSAPDASGNDAISEHILKTNNGCYVVQFENRSGELISCTELLPLQYTKRDCSSGNILERGEVGTVVSCDDKRKFGMKFRNGSNEVVHFILRVTRAPEGKAGVIAKYRVESTSVDSSKLADMLPKPELKSVEDSTPPEEAPLKFKFSGFLTIEQEHSKKFGYDIGNATTGQAAQQNYNKAVSQPKQNVTNLLSNLNFELSKDRSSLNAVLEIGEVYFGNTATGGGQGLRANNTFELRNLYLSHGINDALKGSAGLMTKSSDPRSFVFSDNLSGASLDYKSDLSNGMIWYGNANQSRPGVPFIQRDRYLGVLGSLQFMDGFKPTLFGVWRNWVGELYQFENGGTRGNSDYFWGGATIDITVLDPLTFQYTYIHNWGKFHGDGEEHTDKLKAKLQDAKIMFNWQAPQMTFSLEGLETSGAKGSQNASGQYYIGKRKNFMSPIGAAYLMTIATSDGADDAPGSPKQSKVANLNLPEGLRMAIFTTSANMTKRATVFARAGMIKTQANANITESSDYGKEFDLGGVYQLTPSTIFQIDYGRFYPGGFFQKKDFAELIAGKIKFNF